MATVETVKETTTLPIEYPVSKALLEPKVAEDCQLTIAGIDDKAGYKLVDTKRKEYVKIRTAIDRRRKELNEDARKHIARVNDMAAELTAIAGRAEDHLESECDRIDRELERIQQAKLDAEYNAKNDRLKAAGIVLDRIVVDSLDNEQVDQRIADHLELKRLREEEARRQAEAEAERKRLAAEEAARIKAEAERLAAERAELDRQRRAQDEEFARLKKAEQDRIDAERAELERQRREQQAEQARIDAERKRLEDEARAKAEAERRAKEASEKKAREEAEAKERAAQEEAERKRLEAERPYREQLVRLAESIEALPIPDGSMTTAVKHVLSTAAIEIKRMANVPAKKGKASK